MRAFRRFRASARFLGFPLHVAPGLLEALWLPELCARSSRGSECGEAVLLALETEPFYLRWLVQLCAAISPSKLLCLLKLHFQIHGGITTFLEQNPSERRKA